MIIAYDATRGSVPRVPLSSTLLLWRPELPQRWKSRSLSLTRLASMALSPAYAAKDPRNDAHMEQMDRMIAKMTDAAKKKEVLTCRRLRRIRATQQGA